MSCSPQELARRKGLLAAKACLPQELARHATTPLACHAATLADATRLWILYHAGDVLLLGDDAGFSTASVRALEFCHLHVITKDHFRWLTHTFPSAFGAPMRNIAKLRLDRARPAQPLGGAAVRVSMSESSSSTTRRGTARSSTAYVANAMTDDDVQAYLTQQREEQSRISKTREEEEEKAAIEAERSVGRDAMDRKRSWRRGNTIRLRLSGKVGENHGVMGILKEVGRASCKE